MLDLEEIVIMPSVIPKGVYQPNLRSAAFRSQVTGQPTELAEQFGFLQWMRANFPIVKFFAVPNGGKRDHTEATMKLLEGMTRGVPDIWIPHARKGYHGLVIEFKKAKCPEESVWSWPGTGGWVNPVPVTKWAPGTVSPEQKEWVKHLEQEGYAAPVCEGMQPGVRAVEWYFADSQPAS